MTGVGYRGYLEGDERVYVDGARTPQIHGTGTEDFYEGGWYFNRDTFTTPLVGESGHESGSSGCPTGMDCTSTYRQLIADAVPFGSSLRFGIEHGATDNEQADYASTAFWYSQRGLGTVRSDSVDLADTSSRAAHKVTGGPAATPLSASYEGSSTALVASTHGVVATTAPMHITVAVPAGAGDVRLRRMSDQAVGYQSAAVTVDGAAAGTWLQPLGNTTHRWLDDTFAVPSALTAGKRHLDIVITPLGSTPWTAARYDVLAQVPLYLDRVSPSAVTGLTATGTGTNAVDLQWAATDDNVPGVHYEVYASTDPAVPSPPRHSSDRRTTRRSGTPASACKSGGTTASGRSTRPATRGRHRPSPRPPPEPCSASRPSR